MIKSIFKTFLLSVLIVAQVHFAYAQTASILPPAKTTFIDQNGKPLTSGTVDFYIPGTTTRKTTWKDAAETIPNTNPVVLDGAGRALILGSGDYRQIVKDRLNNVIWDQVTSSTGTGGGGTTTIGDGNNVGTILPWSGFIAPQSYLFAYGEEISRTTYAVFLNVITQQQTVNCNSGSATLTTISDTSQLNIGAAVEAACIPVGSNIISKTINTVTLNNLALVSTSVTATFFPWGNGNGLTTFNVPDLRGVYLPGRNNMGGAAGSLLTNPSYNDPNSLSGGGGNQTSTLLSANLPPYTPAGGVTGTFAGNTNSGINQLTTNAVAGAALQLYGNPSIGGAAVTGITVAGNITAAFAGTPAAGQVSTPLRTLPPSKTVNYVVKVLPNVTTTSTVVTSIGNMTGDIACGTGLLCVGNNISVSLPTSNIPHTQDFLSGIGFTAGVTTALTLSSTPASSDLLTITFDGIGQNANTWSLVGAIVTFNAVIPLNTQVVEAKWSSSSTSSGVSNVNSISGGVNILSGAATNITTVGQNITIGNNIGMISIMDVAFGAKCNAAILSTGTISITSGTKNLTVTSAGFTSADVGKSIWVPLAGPAGAGYSTSISTFTDATHIIVADNASTTVTTQALGQLSTNMLVYGTDDTSAINAAIAATPPFGTLYINSITLSFPVRGCLIKQTGATGRSLLVDHPINILGGGNSSALITDPSMGSTIIDIHALVSSVTWKGITWQGFLLGTDTNFTNFPRYGAHGIWFDATSAGPGGFTGLNIRNISIGESPNGFYSLILDGVGSQGNRIDNNFIVGGVLLDKTADSNQITNNRLLGVSNFGIKIDTPTAGNFLFSGNSTTLAAGVCILNGSSITISNNFFEEQTAGGTYPHNAQLDIGCSSGQAMSAVSVYGNIITAGLSSANNIKIDAAVGFTWVYANELATRLAAIAAITNANATTYCGPNQIITAAPHLSGTAPILWGVAAC